MIQLNLILIIDKNYMKEDNILKKQSKSINLYLL